MNEFDINTLRPFFPDAQWEKVTWTFVCFSRQNYAQTVSIPAEDMVMVTLEHSEGGCICELSFHWQLLGGKLSPQLSCFGDALPMLLTPTFKQVLEVLADLRNPEYTPNDLANILLKLGVVDKSDIPLSEQKRSRAKKI